VTDAEIVSFVAGDALVRERNTDRDTDGTPVPASAAELRARAKTGLKATLSELFLEPNIRRSMLEGEYSLTLTSATEYALPTTISRIIGIYRGSDSEEVRFFESKTDYRDWYNRLYGSTTITDSDEPAAAYVSGRGRHGAINLTISPGTGNQTTLTLDVIKSIKEPLRVSQFPVDVHTTILVGTLDFASGSAYNAKYEQLKQHASRALDPILGGVSVVRHGRSNRRKIRRYNAILSSRLSPSSYFPSPTKGVS
jgi:hypothetical protein